MSKEENVISLLTDCKGERGSPKPIVTAAIWKTVKVEKVQRLGIALIQVMDSIHTYANLPFTQISPQVLKEPISKSHKSKQR